MTVIEAPDKRTIVSFSQLGSNLKRGGRQFRNWRAVKKLGQTHDEKACTFKPFTFGNKIQGDGNESYFRLVEHRVEITVNPNSPGQANLKAVALLDGAGYKTDTPTKVTYVIYYDDPENDQSDNSEVVDVLTLSIPEGQRWNRFQVGPSTKIDVLKAGKTFADVQGIGWYISPDYVVTYVAP